MRPAARAARRGVGVTPPLAKQSRGLIPPQLAITGMPFNDSLARGSPGGGLCSMVMGRSWIAWEARIAPKSRMAEAKFGYVGSRVNLDKCEHPGLGRTDVVRLNQYEGGSYVARSDLIAGPEHEKVFEEWPLTEQKFRTKYLKPPAADEYERRVKFYAVCIVPRAIGLLWIKTSVVLAVYFVGPTMADRAGASIEVNVDWLDEGQLTLAMWLGKPVFIHHRTEKQIAKVANTDLSLLRDPETDAERHKRPKYAIMIGICPHLGCIPVFGDGDFGAYLCPCHGSHYDFSGRLRKGPAPNNLGVPDMMWKDDTTVIIGKKG